MRKTVGSAQLSRRVWVALILPPPGRIVPALDLLRRILGVGLLDGADDAGVQGPTGLLQKRAVGYLVSEGVLEGVFRLGNSCAS